MLALLSAGKYEFKVEKAVSELAKNDVPPQAKSLGKPARRWMPLRKPKAEMEQEFDWLGWDGWVSTDDVAGSRRDRTKLG